MVDGCGNVFQILNEWLGDLVTIAEAEWDGKTLAFHVPIAENERLVDTEMSTDHRQTRQGRAY